MTVYVVEHDFTYSDHWVEAVFLSRLDADEYCIKSGCTERMSQDINTSWQNPDNGLERMHVLEMTVK